MYKLLIETSLSDLLIILIKGQHVLDYIHEQNLIKKSEKLPPYVEQLLINNHITVKEIKQFYITLGPGSFMGARTGLMFARTICQITNSQLFTTNTLMFISGGKNGRYYIDAKSHQSYEGIVSNQQIKLGLTNFQRSTIINYQKIIANIHDYLLLFTWQKNLLNVRPCYLKDPKVG